MKTLITPALLAGLLAAVVLTLAQAFLATPLILEAETYENSAGAAPDMHEHAASTAAHQHAANEHHHHDAKAAEHDHAAHDHSSSSTTASNTTASSTTASSTTASSTTAPAADSHHHNGDAWAPEDGWQRTLSTASANLVMGVGYALMLVALYRFRPPKSAAVGLAWGMAGYLSIFVAPTLGLHPELPGTEAAELTTRQLWWTGTAIGTASGIALCVFASPWGLKVVGLLLLALPHIIGAPLPATPSALAPEALQFQFLIATAIVNAAFWLTLGAASAWLYQQSNALPTSAQDAPVTSAA